MISVTGANGFIGQAVIKYCISNSISVKGYSRRQSTSSVVHQVNSYHDITGEGILIHLAETRGLADMNDGTADVQTQLMRTLCNKGFSRIIYGSSAAVYNHNPFDIVPRSTDLSSHGYSLAKQKNEAILRQTSQGAVARIANVYGANMAENSVISTIMKQRYSKEIEVFSCQSIRDFIWVDDVASGLVSLALSTIEGVYHLGSGKGTSVRELIGVVTKLVNNSSPTIIETKQLPFSRVVLDLTDTEKYLQWRPKVTLMDGMRQLIQDKNNATYSGIYGE
jgi:nucleoside-diphosphate-sugar epimerase